MTHTSYIIINNKKYEYKIFDTFELIELIRKKSKLIKSLEETIKIYRGEPNFSIMNLIREYINSDLNTQTKYSIIHKKNTIISTSRLIYSKNKGYINLVYTNPEFRGYKICQNHIQHLIGLHKDITKKYELEVDIDNIPAIKCYENIGFTKISTNTKLNIYLMRLQI
jgi:hypothetical protein